jgi:hypothetical protein
MTRNKAQITIEFLVFLAMAFVVIFIFLAAAVSLSKDTTKSKTYYEMDDLGRSVQEEMLLASQLEDGYTRKINLPMTLNGLQYSVFLNQSNPSNAYFLMYYEDIELFYLVPPINGSIHLGDNTLRKINGTLRMN